MWLIFDDHKWLTSSRPLTPRANDYAQGPTRSFPDLILKGLVELEPEDADPEEVARAIVKVIDMEHSRRPFRIHIDPSQDGAEIVNGVADRVRRELLRRIGLGYVLVPK